MIAVGIFAQKDEIGGYSKYDGLLHGKSYIYESKKNSFLIYHRNVA